MNGCPLKINCSTFSNDIISKTKLAGNVLLDKVDHSTMRHYERGVLVEDPEDIEDPLPQPYRFINEQLEKILARVGEYIDQKEELLKKQLKERITRSINLPILNKFIEYKQSKLNFQHCKFQVNKRRIFLITETGRLQILDAFHNHVLYDKLVFDTTSMIQKRATPTIETDKKKRKSPSVVPAEIPEEKPLEKTYYISVIDTTESNLIGIAVNVPNAIRIFEFKEDELTQIYELLPPINYENDQLCGLLLSPDGNYFTLSFCSGKVLLYEIKTNKCLTTLECPLFLDNPLSSIDKKDYIIRPRTLFLLNTAHKNEIKSINKIYKLYNEERINEIRSIVVWWEGLHSLCLYELYGNSKREWILPSPITAVALSEKSEYIVTGLSSGSVIVWDMNICVAKSFLENHQKKVISVGFFENHFVISCSEDGIIHIFNISEHALCAKVKCYQNEIVRGIATFVGFPFFVCQTETFSDIIDNVSGIELVCLKQNSTEIQVSDNIIVLYNECSSCFIWT